MKNRPSILFLVSNDISIDNRLRRHASVFKALGFSVSIWGRVKKKSEPLTLVWAPFHCTRFKLFTERGVAFYLQLNLRFLLQGLGKKFDFIYTIDADTLIAGTCLKKITGAKLIHDAHEYFTEVPELIKHPAKQRVWRKIERWGISNSNLALSVCKPIAARYSEEHGKTFHVIRNLTDPVSDKTSDIQLNLPDTFLLYQGILNLGRGIELMIQSMAFLPKNLHLVICGVGDIEDELKALVRTLNLKDRIIFLGRIPPEQLEPITQKAILGMSLESDLGYNYRNALPNKIFSYLHAQIPTICSNLPVMAELVQENAIGEILIDRSPQALAELVLQVKNNRSKYVPPLQKAVLTLNWKQESEKLKQLINRELL